MALRSWWTLVVSVPGMNRDRIYKGYNQLSADLTQDFVLGDDSSHVTCPQSNLDQLHASSILTQIDNYEEYEKNPNSVPELIDPGQSERLSAVVSPLNKPMDSEEDRKHAFGEEKSPIKQPGAPDSYLAAKQIQVDTDPGTAYETKMASDSHPPESSSSEYAEPDLMYTKRDDSPHKGVDTPTEERTMEDELIESPSCGVPEKEEVERSSAIESVPDMTAHSPTEVLFDKAVSPAMAEKINNDIKFQLMKEVRKLGRKYDTIFTLLKDVHGPLSVKKQFVELTIKEAARFKRQFLIKQLEAFLHKMVAYHGKK